ncbi:hypothetical protein SASPL_100309 [Salvia splendens]|uniref:Expansin-like EG45 domain-containing protein n=1 Tax=Salvia splendens TaxID=180675 RepID=A0A8X8YM54_SALSN|nr:hypothetical protein SASPL_100309 [Salvia splendens]
MDSIVNVNATLSKARFLPAVATWYGSPTGSGSGGACGLENDVINAPYYGMISAGSPIHVTITDECPGLCNNEPFHFDLSGKAFGYLAKTGHEEDVRCHYKAHLAVKIDSGSNPYYVAMVVENVNGDGEIDRIEIMGQVNVNATLNRVGFLPAAATWYGNPTGAGSGGACGLENDVINAPYHGMISAGNGNLFRSGAGCGTCYMVKCIDNPSCSGSPIHVTITDECPGLCNNEPFHFDLSGKAFGSLAKPGHEDQLRNAGRINIQYTRVRCHYKAHIAVKIDSGSNPYYLAMAVENVNGDGEIDRIEILGQGLQIAAQDRL